MSERRITRSSLKVSRKRNVQDIEEEEDDDGDDVEQNHDDTIASTSNNTTIPTTTTTTEQRIKDRLRQRLESKQSRNDDNKKNEAGKKEEQEVASIPKKKTISMDKPATFLDPPASLSTSTVPSLLSAMKKTLPTISSQGLQQQQQQQSKKLGNEQTMKSNSVNPRSNSPNATPTKLRQSTRNEINTVELHGDDDDNNNNNTTQIMLEETDISTNTNIHNQTSSTAALVHGAIRTSSPREDIINQKRSLKNNDKLQQMVWNSLQELCQKSHILDNEEEQEEKNYSTILQNPSVSPDMSSSFIRMKEKYTIKSPKNNTKGKDVTNEYDYFDLDEQGGIIIQPTIPMFPEDFDEKGSNHTSWPLSWFGIVDPQLEEAKQKEQSQFDNRNITRHTLPSQTSNDTPYESTPHGSIKQQQNQNITMVHSVHSNSQSESRDRDLQQSPSEHQRKVVDNEHGGDRSALVHLTQSQDDHHQRDHDGRSGPPLEDGGFGRNFRQGPRPFEPLRGDGRNGIAPSWTARPYGQREVEQNYNRRPNHPTPGSGSFDRPHRGRLWARRGNGPGIHRP